MIAGLVLEWLETVMWVVVAVLVAHFIYDRTEAERRAVQALHRDGYTDVFVLGRDCTVTQATDKDGDRVQAWSCPWIGAKP